jgi:hypothetical protein
MCLSLLGGCGPASEDIPQDPPPRPATQTAARPPADFLSADLMVSVGFDRVPYCFGVDELLSWLRKEAVTDQRWTQLEARRWRLDGFADQGAEHTVWIFEQGDDGVELVGYKDSDIADRTPERMMELYYSRVRAMHSDPIRERYGNCTNPYD